VHRTNNLRAEDRDTSILGSFVTSLVLVGMLTSASFGRQDLGAYLTEKDGRKTLKDPLTVHECQDGIAGKTCLVWTIEQSGEWRVARTRLLEVLELHCPETAQP
jgi:hypothetical protein